MQQAKQLFAICYLCAAPYFASSQEVWSHVGANLQFVFNRPEGSNNDLDLSAVISARTDLPLGSRWVLFSPEAYFVRKGEFVTYATNGTEPVVGSLDVRGFGLAVPLGISLLSGNGAGIRLFGGLYGDYNYNPRFFSNDKVASPLEFESRTDALDYGAYSALHFVFDRSFELKLTYFHGFDAKSYLANAPENPVKGSWRGIYRYFTATFGYKFFN
jgi:hypothetical protein